MQNIKEQSLIESAERVLREKKEPLDLYTLFNLVCAEKDYNEAAKVKLITQFYTDLITSAKFVYTGENTWDLKDYQKTDLWDKDGSFYKEYTKVKDIGDGKSADEKPVAKKKRTRKAKPKVEKVVVEEVIEVVPEVVPEVVVEEVVVAKAKPTKESKKKETAPKAVEEEKITEYEEEVFEEFEDEFDEEKYNEYMDTYEDKYDEK